MYSNIAAEQALDMGVHLVHSRAYATHLQNGNDSTNCYLSGPLFRAVLCHVCFPDTTHQLIVD